MLTEQGGVLYAKQLFRADLSIPASGNYFVGLCGTGVDAADTLLEVPNEPSAAGGYARLPVTRDLAGWPSIVTANGVTRVTSKLISFTAVGADFDQPIYRLFLCDVVSGTVGNLLGYSAPFLAPITLTDGETLPVQYAYDLG